MFMCTQNIWNVMICFGSENMYSNKNVLKLKMCTQLFMKTWHIKDEHNKWITRRIETRNFAISGKWRLQKRMELNWNWPHLCMESWRERRWFTQSLYCLKSGWQDVSKASNEFFCNQTIMDWQNWHGKYILFDFFEWPLAGFPGQNI